MQTHKGRQRPDSQLSMPARPCELEIRRTEMRTDLHVRFDEGSRRT